VTTRADGLFKDPPVGGTKLAGIGNKSPLAKEKRKPSSTAPKRASWDRIEQMARFTLSGEYHDAKKKLDQVLKPADHLNKNDVEGYPQG
jgi:hypothetical protein